MIDTYKTVAKNIIVEYVVNKSRFIANIAPVSTEEEAKQFLDKIKKEYYDARHNCYAYILKENGGRKKSSDDGEPSGTAGRPILEVLEKNEITDAIIVVTRYFGGILLGAGGLVRAYSTAASSAVKNCEVINMQLCDIISVKAGYKDADIIKNIIDKSDVFVEEIKYTDNVDFTINIPIDKSKAFIEKINFNGNIITSKTGQMFARVES